MSVTTFRLLAENGSLLTQEGGGYFLIEAASAPASTSHARVSAMDASVLGGASPHARVSDLAATSLDGGNANVRNTGIQVATVNGGKATGRVTGLVVAMLIDSRVRLVSIDVKPRFAAGFVSDFDRFRAMGNFSDGTVRDISDKVTWSADHGTIIDAQGFAEVSFLGDATITATVTDPFLS